MNTPTLFFAVMSEVPFVPAPDEDETPDVEEDDDEDD
jgi:hypothetical protein